MKESILVYLLLSIFCLPVVADSIFGTPRYEDIKWPGGKEASSELIELGKTLFFDPRLVPNEGQSCGSCHDPNMGFSDGMAFDLKGHSNWRDDERNSPMINNLAWEPIIHWDGRTQDGDCFTPADTKKEVCFPALESQAYKSMIKRKVYDSFIPKIKVIKKYQTMFAAAFPGDGQITHANIAWAIGAFERSLVSNNSPFDRYLAGDKLAISPSAERGLALFKGKGNCAICHNGVNLTDGGFHNIGLGVKDRGRAAILEKRKDKYSAFEGAFRTPGLRNVALTAPYMHDGSIGTLEGVIEHYNKGGESKKGLSHFMKPLNLSKREVWDLVAFLHMLTDPIEVAYPEIPQ